MKLGPDMYHLNTFNLQQNEGGSDLTGGRGIQKTIKKCHEINMISALTRPNNSLKNATNVGVFLTVILNHLALVLTGWHWGRGAYLPYGGASY